MRLSLLAANARFVHSAPALFYVRQCLERRLPQSRIVLQQLTINDPYYETLLAVLAEEPEAVLVSAYVWSDAFLRRLLVDLREARPELVLVAGGPQAPHLNLPPACRLTVVEGPAEGLGPEFYADLAAGCLKPSYRADPATPFALPYRAADLAAGLNNRHIYYESSRGCPFACAYCLSAVRPGVHYLPLAQVKEELGRLLAAEPAIIRFVDRTFNAPPERALELWRWLASRSGPTRFHFEIAPDLFTGEQLGFLATVPPGRFQFEIGLQSFTPEALAAVNRRPDLERARRNIRRLLAADNIHLHLDLILGLPFESAAAYRRSLAEILALRPHHLQLGLLKVLPDTPLAARKQEFGLVHCRQPPYPVLATRWLSQPQLAELYRLGEVIEAFYNPRWFRATLGWLLDRHPEPVAFFANLSAVCREHDFFNRAKTQDFLSELLLQALLGEEQAATAVELLRFDWLACGHRRLPPHLLPAACASGEAWLKEVKDSLWRSLPDHLPPHFTPRSRSAFFKRTVFAPFSAPALAAIGLGATSLGAEGSSGMVGFLSADGDGLLARRQTVLFG